MNFGSLAGTLCKVLAMNSQTVGLVLLVAEGLFKFGRRLETLAIEDSLQRSIPMLHAPMFRRIKRAEIHTSFEKLINQADKAPDRFGSALSDVTPNDLQLMREILKRDVHPDTMKVATELFQKYFPDREVEKFMPNLEFLRRLQARNPDLDWNNPGLQAASFHVSAGKKDGNISHIGRVGLLVVDVLSEFGVDAAALLINHKPTAAIVSSLLKNFAQNDLEDIGGWQELFEHSFRSTLSGVVDSRTEIARDNRWVLATIDAIGDARSRLGDQSVLNLVKGDALPSLVGSLLTEFGDELDENDAKTWSRVAADLLTETGGMVKPRTSFDGFFRDHWGDLLGATAKAMQKHGVVIFEGDRPLAHQTVYDLMNHVASSTHGIRWNRELIVSLVDVAISTASNMPERVTQDIDHPWLSLVVEDVVSTVARQGITHSISTSGTRKIVSGALTKLGDHPDVIIEKPGIIQEVVGGVFKSVGNLNLSQRDKIADAVATGALNAITENPQLLKTEFAPVVTTFTRYIADMIALQQLSAVEGEQIIRKAIDAIADNPKVFEEYDQKAAILIVHSFSQLTDRGRFGTNTSLAMGGRIKAESIGGLLRGFARNGLAIISENATTEQFQNAMTSIISVALDRADNELGQGLSISDFAPLLEEIVLTLEGVTMPESTSHTVPPLAA